MSQQTPLADSFGRRINYLRISLTDLCNFRCVYCMPAEGMPSVIPRSRYLVRDEILRFVRIAGCLGISRIRLTGGEPLLRKDLLDIVRALKGVEAVKDLSITTNASRLKPALPALKEAGLDRLNISLDSMNAERFRKVTLRDAYREVMDAVFAAVELGFPVKLNMVALKGLTQDEIIQFCRLASQYDLEVRFLEFMPLCGTGWRPELVLPIAQVRSIVHEHFELKTLPRNGSVAETFQVGGGKGKVGFIASLSESFCDTCSRIRLSADGNIQPCLFSDQKVSVRQLLREKASDEAIIEAIRFAARIKPKGNWFYDHPFRGDENFGELALNTPMIRTIGG